MTGNDQESDADARTVDDVIAAECVAVRLRMLMRAVTRIYNAALRPHGVNVSQMNILVALMRLGECTQQRICEVLYLDKSTLSRDLARIRREGWVDERPGTDGRVRLVRVTAAGRALIDRVFPAWQDAQRRSLRLLGEQDHAAVDRLTHGLRAGWGRSST